MDILHVFFTYRIFYISVSINTFIDCMGVKAGGGLYYSLYHELLLTHLSNFSFDCVKLAVDYIESYVLRLPHLNLLLL